YDIIRIEVGVYILTIECPQSSEIAVFNEVTVQRYELVNTTEVRVF
ncbi:unnamed protein product, partial [Heterotrigona itama]